ncbi:hypothetical protein ES705_13327 [subsurface metagenome]
MKTFGNYIKEKRIEKKITLRKFCKQAELDPSNWSKIERGLLQPPKSRFVLEIIANILKMKKGSEEYYTLFDLAAISFVPNDLIADEKVLEKLPVFFRTVRGEPPTREELEKLINLIREG